VVKSTCPLLLAVTLATLVVAGCADKNEYRQHLKLQATQLCQAGDQSACDLLNNAVARKRAQQLQLLQSAAQLCQAGDQSACDLLNNAAAQKQAQQLQLLQSNIPNLPPSQSAPSNMVTPESGGTEFLTPPQ
jgi:hypothetical protein